MASLRSMPDEKLAWLLLQALCQWHDAGGKSAGRSFDSELLEPAMRLMPVPKNIPEPPIPPHRLIREAWRRIREDDDMHSLFGDGDVL